MSSKKEGRRDYKFSIKLYPDSRDYDAKKCIASLQEYFEEYAWIIHDKDKRVYERNHLRTLTVSRFYSVFLKKSGVFSRQLRRFNPYLKPHYHFYGRNNCHCKISAQQIVRYLGLPYEYTDRPNDIAPASDWLACLYYTVHRNAPDKYQYDVSEVHTNIPRFVEKISFSRSMHEDLKILYDILDEAETMGVPVPYYELVRKMTLRNCTLQFSRPSMVEKISISFQYNRMGRVVQ